VTFDSTKSSYQSGKLSTREKERERESHNQLRQLIESKAQGPEWSGRPERVCASEGQQATEVQAARQSSEYE